MRRQTTAPALAAAAIAAGLLGLSATRLSAQHAETGGVTKAIAVLHATKSGGEASGTVEFTKVADGVRVVAEIRGLAPGKHGFHIHEFGDCSSPDAMSAGSHFNPEKTPHGQPGAAHGKRHVGDLGNLEANARGVAKADFVDKELSFSGAASIIGRGVIVHEKEDNFGQPVGNAGGRVACGVVGIAKGS